MIGKEKNKWLAVDKKVLKLLQTRSLPWRTMMISEVLKSIM